MGSESGRPIIGVFVVWQTTRKLAWLGRCLEPEIVALRSFVAPLERVEQVVLFF